MGGKTPRLPQNDPTPIAEVYPGKFQKLGLRPSPKNLYHIMKSHQNLKEKSLPVRKMNLLGYSWKLGIKLGIAILRNNLLDAIHRWKSRNST